MKYIQWACQFGDIELISELVNGINVNDYIHGQTPLIISSQFGRHDSLEYLISIGADLESKNKLGVTALMYSAANGDYNIVELLLDNNANIENINHAGQTALFMACLDLYNETLNKKNNSIVKCIDLLIKNGANLDHKDNNGNTVLSVACIDQDELLVLLLVEKGFSLYIENDLGETAFDILNKAENLPARLQALKEKLILTGDIEDVEQIGLSL